MRAAIDVGTNTVRLLLGETSGGRVNPGRYCRRITRLGGGFAGSLAPEAMERTAAALREFAAVITEAGVTEVRAVGTEVLRAAANAAEFVRRVEDETGIFLNVIEGAEEARLTAAGVLAALEPPPAVCLIIDIGGGSTEFILWHHGAPRLQRSFPLGAVRLAEDLTDTAARCARIDGVLRELRSEIEREGLFPLLQAAGCRLVGTAGTVTTLAALHLRMRDYDWRRINNLVLQGSELRKLQHLLEPLSVAAREQLPGMEKGRGDLIVPGLHILLAILDLFSFDRLTVSDFGLLEGLLLGHAQAPV